MRVLIEFFDKEPIENVIGACVFKPDVVVYLCDQRDATFFKESAIYRLFRRRKIKTQPRFFYFDAFDPTGILRVLQAVVRDYPDCVFDFSGGRDLVLLVAGSCFAEMRLPGFYIDVQGSRFINLRGCEALQQQFYIPAFSADDILAMAGATIHGSGHFSTHAFDAGFAQQALATYAIVQRNPKAWSSFVTWLQHICAGSQPTALEVEGPRKTGGKQVSETILQHLRHAGVVQDYSLSRHRASVHFTSALHRKCLLIEGVWLELYCYFTALDSGLFDDVRTSVVVDWDGVEGGPDNTKNEVDVLLVKGITPIFISCKMSAPSALALSEIRLLSTKFGGALGRTVVLTAALLDDGHRAIKARASELGIELLDRSVTQQEGQLTRELLRILQQPPFTQVIPPRGHRNLQLDTD